MTAQTQTAKHTQGKWTIRGPVYGGPSNFEQNVGTDSTCTAIACGTSRHELEANAALIAAAPDLLAALGECVSEPGAKCWDDPKIAYRRLRAINDIARAAIARAESRADA